MTDISKLPEYLQDRLNAELNVGEWLAWVGQPNPNRAMLFGLIYTVISTLILAYVVYRFIPATEFRLPDANLGSLLTLLLWGLIFFSLVTGMTKPLRRRRDARNTVYAP